MLTPEDFLTALQGRLTAKWAAHLTGEKPAWPHRTSLGLPAKQAALEGGWTTTYQPFTAQWREWARQHPVELHQTRRKVHGGPLELPTAVSVDSIDTAAELVRAGWPGLLEERRARWSLLSSHFPETVTTATLRKTATWSDVDIGLLVRTAEWFRETPQEKWQRLTARQTGIPGVHSKWLDRDGHRVIAQSLAGVPPTPLTPRPTTIDLTYACPAHRENGGRWLDSCAVGTPETAGPPMIPAYPPRVVLVCENKDTCFMFPPEIPGLIVVWGEGDAAKKSDRIPAVDWIAHAPRIIYWGDMDAEGFQILSRFRALIAERGGPVVESILMDPETFKTFNKFGTEVDRKGKPLERRDWDSTVADGLTNSERETYRIITDPNWPLLRRVEQEPIPLDLAVDALRGSAPRRDR